MICRELTILQNSQKDFYQRWGEIFILPLWILNGGQVATFKGNGRADRFCSDASLQFLKNSIAKTIVIALTILSLPLIGTGLILIHLSETHKKTYNSADAHFAYRLRNWVHAATGDRALYEEAAAQIFNCYVQENHVLDLRGERLGQAAGRGYGLRQGLSSLPSVIGELFFLEVLHLENNQMNELPAHDLIRLPFLHSLYLEGNPLSDSHIESLSQTFRRNRSEDLLPAIYFDRSYDIYDRLRLFAEVPQFTLPSALHRAAIEAESSLPSPVDMSLITLVRFWKELAESSCNDNALISFLSEEEHIELVRSYLLRLRETEDYQDAAMRKTLAQNIMTILNHASTNKEFKEDFLALIHEALTSCMDRLAQGFNQIMCAYHLSIASKTNEGKALVVIGAVRLKLLDEFAEKMISSTGGAVDGVEVHLALQICLKEALKLPIGVQTMHYGHIACVNDAVLAQAKREVLAQTSTKEDILEALVSHDAWKKWMNAKNPFVYDAIRDEYAEKLEGLATDTNYFTNVKLVEKEREKALHAAYKEATDAWLKSKPSVITALI